MTKIDLEVGSGETGEDPHLGFLHLQSLALCEQASVVRQESGHRAHVVTSFLEKAQTDPGTKRREWDDSHWDSS